MKRKIFFILALILLIFGVSFYVGQNILFHDVEGTLDKPKDNIVNTDLKTDDNSSNNQNVNDTNIEDNDNTTNDEIDANSESTDNTQDNKKDTTTSKDTTSNKDTSNENTTTSKNNTTTNDSSKNNANSSGNSNTNTNSNDNKSKEDPTSKAEEKKEKEIVKTEKDVAESELKYEKYGSKFYLVNYYNVYTYDDGTTEKKFLYSTTKIDTSGYNGTAASMLQEAKEIVEKNRKDYEKLLEIVNGYRKELDREPLVLDENLTLLATIRAMELAYYNNVSHVRPNGKSYASILTEFSISPSWSGENIAAGQQNVEEAALSWRESDGHYKNMVNVNFTKVGLGMYKLEGTGYGIYWAQLFTS